MNRVKDKRLWLSIVGITGLGLLSGLFSVNAREYYQALRLPSFAPPGWLFGPVWLVLYIFMGITFYFILVHPNKQQKKRMITLFILQFIANFFWTFFFFSLQNNLLSSNNHSNTNSRHIKHALFDPCQNIITLFHSNDIIADTFTINYDICNN